MYVAPKVTRDIDICQHRHMSKSVLELTPVEAVACCSPVTREALSVDAADRIAPLVKALADPVRLRLVSLVASHADGEACVCDLNDAFDLSQPTISHHLKLLHEAGILDREKRGVWVYYRVNARALSDLATMLGGVTV
jgi:ArsR family transcriptional regulator